VPREHNGQSGKEKIVVAGSSVATGSLTPCTGKRKAP